MRLLSLYFYRAGKTHDGLRACEARYKSQIAFEAHAFTRRRLLVAFNRMRRYYARLRLKYLRPFPKRRYSYRRMALIFAIFITSFLVIAITNRRCPETESFQQQ